MPRSRSPYPPEYRQQLVELVRGGRTPEELSREFEPSAQSIWNWVRQAELDGGLRSDALLPAPCFLLPVCGTFVAERGVGLPSSASSASCSSGFGVGRLG